MMKAEQDEKDFEPVKIEFIEAWNTGERPTLQDYVRRYPQFTDELIEFVLSFVPLERAAQRVAEPPMPSASTLEIVRQTVAGAQASATNLTEARNAMKWTVNRLARELNVPKEIVMWLERGGLRQWPHKLEEKLAHCLCRTGSQVAALLRSSTPAAAPAHFSARGKPQTAAPKVRTFREALEYCEAQGHLTPEQRREWLEESDEEESV